MSPRAVFLQNLCLLVFIFAVCVLHHVIVMPGWIVTDNALTAKGISVERFDVDVDVESYFHNKQSVVSKFHSLLSSTELIRKSQQLTQAHPA